MKKFKSVATSRRLGMAQAGFSLAEMLVVVGIVSVLSAVGYPRYKTFTASAKQSEAKNNLSHIYTLEQTYASDAEAFADMVKIGPTGSCTPTAAENPINFKLTPCDTTDWKVSRYVYSVTGADDDSFTAWAETGTVNSNLVSPGCASADKWKILETKVLSAVYDSSGC